jgi:hypothetical protein
LPNRGRPGQEHHHGFLQVTEGTQIQEGEIMKKSLLSVLLLLLFCVSASAGVKKTKLSAADLQKRQAVMASADHQIVPGSRIGPIRLGMGQDQVLEILGQPDYDIPGNRAFYPRYQYISLNLCVSFSGGSTPTVIVIEAQGWTNGHNKTLGDTYWKQIERVEMNWSTGTGVKLGSSSFDVKRAFSAYGFDDSRYSMLYKNLGISFTLTADRMVDTISVSTFD